MLSALLEVILPVVLVAAVGVVVGRTLRPDVGAVSKITLFALAPALTLDTLARTELPGSSAAVVIAGYLLSVAVMGLLAWLSGAAQPATVRRAGVVAVIIGNNGNFGLPISLFALGQPGLDRALVVFVASVLVTFTVGPAVLSPRGTLAARARSVLRLPLVWAAALGLLLNATETSLPTGLGRGITLLAGATLPMVLLALGLQIGTAGVPRPEPFSVRTGLLRLVVGPVVAYLCGRLVGARGLELQVLLLASAMPTAVNAFLLAKEMGALPEMVAGTVVLTTLGSLLTIAVVVALLPVLAG